MKNKLKILNYFILLISIIIFTIVNFNSSFRMTYFFGLIYFISLAVLIYLSGMIVNKEENYKNNMNIYLILYFVLLINLTLFMNRPNMRLIDLDNFTNYKVNFIPFKTIFKYVLGDYNLYIRVYNLIGNIAALIPLSFLLILKDKKYIKFSIQFIYIFITVLVIEIIQFITMSGTFDIDDFILNISGPLILLFITNKFKIRNYLKYFFYNDFKTNNKIKIILYCILFVVILGLNFFILFNI